MPGISTVQLSTMLAKRTLSSYLDKIDSGADISDRECIRANASVGFLNDDEYGRDRLKKYFPQFDEKIKVTGMNSEIWAPSTTRENKSRPILSVPKRK